MQGDLKGLDAARWHVEYIGRALKTYEVPAAYQISQATSGSSAFERRQALGMSEWRGPPAASDKEVYVMDELSWFWLSFADAGKPRGEQFLGVVILQARDSRHAHMESHRLGLNPGGEVLIYPTTEPHEQYRNRVLSRIEAGMLGDPIVRRSGE